MTKRFFYSDPLAAAWQAKHFGMEFNVNDFDGVTFIQWSSYRDFNSGNFEHIDGRKARFKIHPHSLHLLDPAPNDYIEYYNCFIGTVWKVEHGAYLVNETSLNNGPEEERDYANLERVAKSDIDKIIQRNGVAFHWPESEDA